MALGGFLEFSSNLLTRAPLAIERIYAMTNEEDILAFEVSDEALEAAAGSRTRSVAPPDAGGGAEMLGGSASDVAQRIADIVKERMTG